MKRRNIVATGLCAAGLALAGCGQPAPQQEQIVESAPKEATLLTWEDLVPEGEEERLAELYAEQYAAASSLADIEEGGAGDIAIQIGSYETVDTFEAVRVRLPGYAVPFEYGDTEISEFLLVPYFGACLHAPPPPPNQTIYVTLADPMQLRDLTQAVWIEGTLRTSVAVTDLADAAYTIEVDTVEAY